MNTDGSAPTNRTNHFAGDYEAAFSPDSQELVFYSDRSGSNDIYITSATSNAIATKVTSSAASDTDPSWCCSPAAAPLSPGSVPPRPEPVPLPREP